MNEIIYNNKITKQDLEKLNITIDESVKIGENVSISSGVKLIGETKIEDNCEIKENCVIINSQIDKNVKIEFSIIEDSFIGECSTVGPFATIKKNSKIGSFCRIGNFVEIKKSNIGNKTKIAHLTYVGDAEIGDGCNLGCGVVFCNYDGAVKRKSIIGNNVFVGSNVNIIAPVEIGDGAYIAAGSTINKNIGNNQFAIARSFQTNKDNFINPYLNKNN